MTVEKMPEWITGEAETDETGCCGKFWDAGGDGGWVNFNAGETTVDLDGSYTVEQLRQLADMVEANL
jgi:hypothetical protein